jgi:hypothetical protein
VKLTSNQRAEKDGVSADEIEEASLDDPGVHCEAENRAEDLAASFMGSQLHAQERMILSLFPGRLHAYRTFMYLGKIPMIS